MKIAFIALQVILGMIFLFTGIIKLTTPKDKLPEKGVTGFEGIAPNLIKLLASAEVAGASALLIFSIPGFPEFTIKVVATCFALLMVAASYHHLKRKEGKNMGVTLTIMLLCLFIIFFK